MDACFAVSVLLCIKTVNQRIKAVEKDGSFTAAFAFAYHSISKKSRYLFSTYEENGHKLKRDEFNECIQ